MTVDEPVFLDTNILLYAHIEESPLNKLAVRAIDSFLKGNYEVWVSNQVLREYLAVMTRPPLHMKPEFRKCLAKQISIFRNLFNVAHESDSVFDRLVQIIQTVPTGGKQIHDANIVATMMEYKINYLVTHNMDDFQRFSDFVTLLSLQDVQSLV